MVNERNQWVFQVFNILGFITMVTVNSLANIVRFNNKNTGELSDLYPNLFVPAGITFAVWGFIYLALLGFTIWQAKDLFRRNKTSTSLHQKVGFWFFLSSILNSLWIFAWHYEMLPVSLIIMLLLLITLVIINVSLGIGLYQSGAGEKAFVWVPFSAYLGWISIATIANVTALLVKTGWDRFGLTEVFWTLLVLLIGLGLTILAVYVRNDIIYGLVVIWAYSGIIIKRVAVGTPDSKTVALAAAICLVPIALSILIRLKRWVKG